MTEIEIIEGLETLYQKFTGAGDDERAQETLMKIADLRMKYENKSPDPGNLLLG
jgi:hypothetical protein